MKKPELYSLSSKQSAITLQSVPSQSQNTLKPAQVQDKRGITLYGNNHLPNLSLSENLHKRLTQYISQKKDRAGLLFGTDTEQSCFQLSYLNVVDDVTEEEVFTKVFAEECACAVFAINDKLSLKSRLQYQISRCKQGYKFQTILTQQKGLTVLEQVYASVTRIFLLLKLQNNVLKADKFCFYPNINISIKPIIFESCKYSQSNLLRTLINLETKVDPHFKQELRRGTFGYLTFDEQKLNISVIKRDDNAQSKPVAGVWVYFKNIKKKSQPELNPNYHKLIWGLATMYVTNMNFVKINVLGSSVKYKKGFNQSFLFCVFTEDSEKPTMYLASLEGDSNKWMFTESNEEQALLPRVPITFTGMAQCPLESIWSPKVNREAELEQQEPQFVPTFNKTADDNIKTQRNNTSQIGQRNRGKKEHRVYSNDTFAKSQADAQSLRESQFNDKTSQKSYDQKDIEIRQLKKQLEFYKERYNNLEKMMMMNQSMMQQFYPQILNQMTMMHNPMMGFQGFPYMNMNGSIPPVQQMYELINQFHHPLFASQANIQNVKPNDSNIISQSSVMETARDDREEIVQVPQPPFLKKQSNPQIISTLKLNHQISAPTKKQIESQLDEPKNQQSIYTDNLKVQKPQQSIEEYKQPVREFEHQVERKDEDYYEFEEHSRKQFDLNLSAIPVEKSPRRYDQHDPTPELLDYSSLAYSHMSQQNPYRYTISNEDSQDYEQNEQAKLIQRMYRNMGK